MSDILKEAAALENYLITMRRNFHQHPELSEQEYETQKTIMLELDKLGIPYEKVGSTSLIATLKGPKPGKTVALRADTDALPIIEETGVDYASQIPGVCHACGHDGHTAMLLGAAKILADRKDEIAGEVRFFFQEGEELLKGAKKIIAAGGMAGVDAVFGLHGTSMLETGYYDLTPGYRMAGSDTIYVKFEGVSGHGSAPHLAKDTIHPASQFVLDLQGIVTKKVDPQQPIVLSVGRFQGGTRANIIAKYTEIDLTMRFFDQKVREAVHAAIKKHAQAIADAYDLKVDVIIDLGTFGLCNDEVLTAFASKSAAKVFGEEKNITLPRVMGAEDMSFYFQHAQGVFAQLGFNNKEKDTGYYPHHERFNIDEDCLKYGAALHAQFALDFLAR